jgi:hypothetical protein
MCQRGSPLLRSATPNEYRQRIKKRLNSIALSTSHLVADSQMCGEFATFEERDGVITAITAITGVIATLNAVADKFTTPGTDTTP